MHRRVLFALPLLLGASQLPELIQPQTPADDDMVSLPVGRGFRCPALRARILAVLHLIGADILAIAFGADTPWTRIDLLALVGTDGRLLALDPLSLSGAHEAHLATRLAVLPDRRHIAMPRDGARRSADPPHAWLRESWTDYWRWAGDRLIDAPARPVLAGTWQDGLARRRASVTALLTPPRYAATPDLVAAVTAPPLPLAE